MKKAMLYYACMGGLNEKAREKLGNKFKEAREKKEMTQIEVAQKAGIHSNYYARVERGEVTPRIDIINKILKALGINSSEIFPL